MKTLFSIIIGLGIAFPAIGGETKWNKELVLDSPMPGGTPLIGVTNLAGIGTVINKEDGKTVITKFFEGSGAADAGLRVSDVITHVDGKDISALELPEITAIVRGEPNTTVILTVIRDGETKPQKVTVTRHPMVTIK